DAAAVDDGARGSGSGEGQIAGDVEVARNREVITRRAAQHISGGAELDRVRTGERVGLLDGGAQAAGVAAVGAAAVAGNGIRRIRGGVDDEGDGVTGHRNEAERRR